MNDDLDRQRQDSNNSEDDEGPISARSLITFSSDNEKRLQRTYEKRADNAH